MRVLHILVLFIATSFALSAPASIQAPPKVDKEYAAKTHTRLTELQQEIENLKHRESNLPEEQKSAFQTEVASVEKQFREAITFEQKLGVRPSKVSKRHMSDLVSLVEKKIDRAENKFGQKSFSLDGILGF